MNFRLTTLIGAVLQIAALVADRPLGLDLFMPVPAANPMTAEKIESGRRLFFDRRLSRDQSVSCSTCHLPDRGFADGRTIAVGVFGRQGRRNASAIINRGYGKSFFWDGRAATLEELVLRPIEDPNEMDLPLDEATRRVGVTRDDLSASLATFVRSILSGDSPFDRFAAGDANALSREARHGLEVYRGRGSCVTCHIGPNFTDEKLHNTGVAWDGHALKDMGGGRGDFKTPTLREIARTAPYMHDGSLATLEDVVDFYDRGGRLNPDLDREIHPLELTADEKHALVSFLRSLSGTISAASEDRRP